MAQFSLNVPRAFQESSGATEERAEQAGHSDQQNPDPAERSEHPSGCQATNEQLFAGRTSLVQSIRVHLELDSNVGMIYPMSLGFTSTITLVLKSLLLWLKL